jgi:hypothetical protein
MHKFIAIAASVGVAAIAVTVIRGAQTHDAKRAELQMPSVLHIMSTAGNLPQTPIVGP